MLIILKKKRSEKPIFILYFVFVIILAFFIRKNIDTLRTSRVKHNIEAVGHFLSGESYFKRAKYGQAINEYKKATLYGYEDERIHLQCGVSYFKEGSFEEAATELERSLEITPNSADCYACLGAAYLKIGKYNKTITLYKEAIRKHIDMENFYMYLGILYLDRRHFREAIDALSNAVALGKSPEICYPYIQDARRAFNMSTNRFDPHKETIK